MKLKNGHLELRFSVDSHISPIPHLLLQYLRCKLGVPLVSDGCDCHDSKNYEHMFCFVGNKKKSKMDTPPPPHTLPRAAIYYPNGKALGIRWVNWVFCAITTLVGLVRY